MILIALGGNLPHPRLGAPANTLAVALNRLEERGVFVLVQSNWYTSPPDPPSGQGWYTNGVAQVATDLDPPGLLQVLLETEAELGRRRAGEARNAARTADLDLLDYDGRVQQSPDGTLVLPHPRLHARSFVLLPLAEVAPGWMHPTLHQSVEELIAALPPGPRAEPMGASEA